MASGGSSRPLVDSRSVDFGSDELLLFSDDYAQQKDQLLKAKRSEFTAKDLHENRVGRPLAIAYNQQEEFPRQDVLLAVDICMKKYADNLLRNLEEISGRLSKLELCCHRLERSMGELQADMIRREGEADTMLESLQKQVHEVQRSLQIIRDRQELASAQKELTKLQLLQKETANSSLTQRSNKDAAAETLETKIQNDNKVIPNPQFAITLPNQMPSSHPITASDQNPPHNDQHQSVPALLNASLQNRYAQNLASTYNTPHQPPPPLPPQQEQQYAPQRAQMHNISVRTPPQPPISQYQQHWPQQPSSQSQFPRPQIPPTYAPYAPYQPAITESFRTSTMPLSVPYSGQQSIGYSSYPQSQHNVQLQMPPPASSNSYAPPQMFANNDHIGINQYPPANMQGYNPVISIDDGRRAAHPQNYQTNINTPSSQIMRNHPYGDIIEKAVGMGYSRDHVVRAVKSFGETGQTLDFNALLDELNAHGGPPTAWSR